MKEHHYQTKVEWTGNKGSGTDHYKNYERSHNIIVEQKAVIQASSDPAFLGDQPNIILKIYWYHLFLHAICFGTCTSALQIILS